MKQQSNNTLKSASQALKKLTDQYRNHADVTLIDMGMENLELNHQQIVLRIHLRHPKQRKTDFPAEIDGFPVKIIVADYKIT